MKVFAKICLGVALVSIGLGIGLLFLATGRRGSLQYAPKYSMEYRVEDVKELDINMDYGEITIIQGNEFAIEAYDLYNTDDLKSYVSDGVWVISHDTSNNFDLFGFNIPITIGILEFDAPSIIITVPKEFQAEDINIMLNTGRLKADNLSANTGSFAVDAGSLEIDGLVIKEEASFTVGAGHISLKKVDVSNIIVECNLGSVNMEGKVTGENKIFCDVGKITLNLKDNMDYYSFDIDSDLGNVIINNRKYHDSKIRSESHMYKGSFLLKVDVGNISMDFRKK